MTTISSPQHRGPHEGSAPREPSRVCPPPSHIPSSGPVSSSPEGRRCPVMQHHGALYDPIPGSWAEQADLAAVTVGVLGEHGDGDSLSPLASARARYGPARSAELVSISGGSHDALNDQDRRTAAATVVLLLERLRRLAGGAPIAARAEPAQP
jgi:hypothetical protein